MSTLTTIPVLEPSPEYGYNLTTFEPGGDSIQDEGLTFDEYDALRKHLAKLRGLIPDEEPTAAQPNVTAETAPGESKPKDQPKPQTKTAEMAVSAIETCIGELESKRDVMLAVQETHPQFYMQYLGDALMLKEILSDWGAGYFEPKFPGETELIASIRGNLDL